MNKRNSIEKIQWLIRFFTSRVNNLELYDEICQTTRDRFQKDIKRYKKVRFGLFTIDDFAWFLYTKGILKDERSNILGLDLIAQKLVENYILDTPGSIFQDPSEGKFYELNMEEYEKLESDELIENLVFGFEYIVKKYANSIVKIEHKNDEVISIGTGFLINDNKTILTNKHCVVDCTSLRVETNDNLDIKIESIKKCDFSDLAIINLKEVLIGKPLILNIENSLLMDLITIGYPSVAMTKDAYQLVHKGEINSIVKDYSDNDFIIFSALASPGSSGSPLIDKFGRVLGIITNAFYNQKEYESNGIPPYYAAIPSKTIIKFIK